VFSASSEARDRNAPTTANQIRLQTSRIRQEHRPIRYQLPARLSFRQGQVVIVIHHDLAPELFLTRGISNIGFWRPIQEGNMATQIVMDHNGDTRHNFETKDAQALLKAERRFKELTGAGYIAASRAADGEPIVSRKFDPTSEETLFFPRLVGG
jgi:hypothetical protein